MWKPHDLTTLPTSEEKELNDEALHILSSELFAARLLHDAEGRFRHCQAEVDRIEHEIALHKYYAAPVRKLPSEILAKIGMILAMSSESYYWKVVWIFSWTCRAWRNALMANPNVWGARIVVPECRNQLSLVLAARHYARGAHISLSVSIGDCIHPTLLTPILKDRPKQITTLHLSTGGHLCSMFSNVKALPNLRRISLCGDTTRVRRVDYQPLLNGLIPRKNCRPSATKLHEVFLSGIYTGTPRVFGRLTSLYLVQCALPPAERFIDGISGSSDTLEYLTLHSCRWPGSGSDSVPPSYPKDFPHLRNLRTSGTDQTKLLRLMRCTALEFFESGIFDKIWEDPLSIELFPPALSVFGLVVTGMWTQFDLMQGPLQGCLERSTKLRIYGDWSPPLSIDESCRVMAQNPLIFGNTITQIEIAWNKMASEQFTEEHLTTIKAGFDSVGRDISIRAFSWDAEPDPINIAPWGTFAVSRICTFINIDHSPRPFGNDTDVL